MNTGDKPLFRFFFYLIFVLLLASAIATAIYILIPVADAETPEESRETTDSTTDSETVASKALLTETADAGIAYQNQILFFGESTTFHMISRKVLSGGDKTTQVIRPVDATLTLIYFDTENGQLISPSTGASETLSAIITEEKPAYLVMNFGINGLNYNVGMHGDSKKAYFISQYQALIDIVRTASPDTVIILQAVYPLADSPDCETVFACSAEEANKRIDSLNQAILALAEANDIFYLNSAEVLKDQNGNLKAEYAQDVTADCKHLNAAGYEVVLSYIRTHSVQ